MPSPLFSPSRVVRSGVAITLIALGCGRGGLPEDDPRSAPCHTVERVESWRATLALERDDAGTATPLMVRREGGAPDLALSEGPTAIEGASRIVLSGGSATLTIDVQAPNVGTDPMLRITCTPKCIVEPKSVRTGHNTGRVSATLELQRGTFAGWSAVHLEADVSVSVSECH